MNTALTWGQVKIRYFIVCFWMILKIEMNAVFLYINGRSRRVFRLAYVQINIGVLWVPFKLFTSRGRQYVQ